MKHLNKCLLISCVLGAAYAIYAFLHFGTGMASGDSAEALGAGIATALVTPHLICTVIAVIFNGLGLFMKKSTFALVGAILYAVSMVLFIPYFFFVIIEMILSFVGFSQLKKASKAE